MSRSRRAPLLLLFVTMMTVQSCHNYLHQGFNEDKVFQASAGQGWRDGFGFTVPALEAGGRIVRVPMVGFPPGYSLLYGAAIGIAPDPFLAGFILDTLAAGVFCATWYWLLTMLGPGIGPAAGLIVGAYWAVAFSPLVALPSSDSLSLALYSASVAIVVRVAAERRGILWAAGAGAAAGAAAAVRFAYWPLVVVPAILLAIAPRERRVARVAAYGFPVLAMMLWATIVNLRASGVVTSVLKTSRTMHWRNILETSPFGARIFGFDVAWSRLAASVPALAPAVPFALWAVTVFVLVVGVARAVRDVRESSHAGVRAFSAGTVLTLLVTSGLIGGLGVLTPPDSDGWTITHEASRYLGPAFPFLMITFARAATAGRRVVALAAIALLAVGGSSVIAYRVGQVRMTLTRNREAYASGPAMRATLAALHAAVRSGLASGRPVVYCDPDLTREYFAIMAGAVSPRGGCSEAERQAASAAGAQVLDRAFAAPR